MSLVKILDPEEIQKFESPPVFTYDQRRRFFQLPHQHKKKLSAFRKPVTQAGFILLQGYFRHSGKFFLPKQFLQADVKFVISLLGLSIEPEDILEYLVSVRTHRFMILEMFGYKEFSSETTGLKDEVRLLVEQRISPKKIFYKACEWLEANKVETPTFFAIQSIITDKLNSFEKSLVNIVAQNIDDYQKEVLSDLLDEDLDMDLVAKDHSRITRFKKQNHSPRPQKIKDDIAVFQDIQYVFQQLIPVIGRLNMPASVVSYYAGWVYKANTPQIRQLADANNRFLHLIAFIYHQYYQRQDLLIDLLQSAVQSIKNSASIEEKEKYFKGKEERNEALRALIKSRTDIKSKWEKAKSIIEDEDMSDQSKLDELHFLVDSDYEEEDITSKIKTLERELEGPDNASYFEGLEIRYTKLRNKVSEIIKVTDFNEESSQNKDLIDAILFYKTGSAPSKSAPMDFMNKQEQALVNDKKGKFRSRLYKIFLYFHVADSIRNGTLYLRHSYKYLTIEDYLIDKKLWIEGRQTYLERAELVPFADKGVYLDFIGRSLHDHFVSTNENINNKSNAYLRISSDGNPIVVTPPSEKPDLLRVSSLFVPAHYTSMLNVLLDVDVVTSFLDSFEHFTVKDVKGKPDRETFFAGIMGYGCNIGISKMGNISKGINSNTLSNTVNWYFTLDNILAANDRLVTYIDSLPLARLFRKYSDSLHTSSDGQKFNLKVESLNSNYSYKYHGKNKGASVHSFIDERFALFYSSVVSSSEREAAYVIDGLLHNDVIRSDIHSTDTHGYSETLFGIMNLLGITFAPRIQNFKDQRLYSIEPLSVYQDFAICADKKINLSLIEEHWDDILRFVASIKLKHVTASQLLKRLSSYTSKNPLYMALQEFGKIHKTIFLLRYMDDVELRSRIEKQLNKIELSHKFAKAVFFGGNQEFREESKEGQEIVAGCRRIIQNAIILWNYFYLSQIISQEETIEKKREVLEIIQSGSVLTWQHVNLHGEYNFDKLNRAAKTFNISQIMEINLDLE